MSEAGTGLCVVVGVGPGLGYAIARRFGQERFRVALVARREGALEGHRARLASEGIAAQAFTADCANAESLKGAFAQIKEKLGDTEVLVYNAALAAPSWPSRVSPDTLLAELKVDVVGPLVSAQQVLPDMRRRRHGTILFTGGGLSLEPFPEFSALAIGKSGIRSLALSLAKEVRDEGIHVATVTVCGFVRPSTHYDPDLIADEYWKLHGQSQADWEREIVYR